MRGGPLGPAAKTLSVETFEFKQIGRSIAAVNPGLSIEKVSRTPSTIFYFIQSLFIDQV